MDILNQLFEFDDLDGADVDSITVTGVTLKVPIGKFSIGSEFDTAYIDWSDSTLMLTAGEYDHTFNLKLTATDAPLT